MNIGPSHSIPRCLPKTKENLYQKIKINFKKGTFLAVQWLRFQASTAGGVGSIPGQETKIPHTAQWG